MKTMVEKASGKVINILRPENGGEYISKEFENCLRGEGIRHEYTIWENT